MRSLEQKMVAGTNVSSSKTTEWNILIVFYLLLCFWWVEKIVDNEQVRQTQPSSAGSYLIVVQGRSVSAGQLEQRCRGINDQG